MIPQIVRRFKVDYLALKYWDTKKVWTPRKIFVGLESIKIDRPIFLLGTQGGGLTLLSRMIRRHPQVVMIGGNHKFWAGNDEMDKHIKDLPDDWALRSPGYGNMLGHEMPHMQFGLERSWVYATDCLLSEYRKTEADYSPRLCDSLKNAIRQAICAYAPNICNSRFLDKSQSYSLKVPLTKKCLPDAKFVVVTRDPYVMCWREASRKPEHKYRLWARKPTFEEGIDLAAQHWRNTFRIALADLKKDGDGLVIRFEDLVSDPERKLREVLQYIELDYSNDLIPSAAHKLPRGSKDKEKWYPIKPDVNQKYLQQMTPRACEIVFEALDGLGEKLGYTLPINR